MQIFSVRHTEFDIEVAKHHHQGLFKPCYLKEI